MVNYVRLVYLYIINRPIRLKAHVAFVLVNTIQAQSLKGRGYARHRWVKYLECPNEVLNVPQKSCKKHSRALLIKIYIR